ncbi:MAG: DUF1801 domain-containing protein [Kofleriaceae bacterium]
MHPDIRTYNNAQPAEYQKICNTLAKAIDAGLPAAESKLWHRGPVWFLDENPVTGYWARKSCVQLLFWSGKSFDEPGLEAEGKFMAAQLRITSTSDIVAKDLKRWLGKAKTIQWDYKNIVRRRGVLEKLGDW